MCNWCWCKYFSMWDGLMDDCIESETLILPNGNNKLTSEKCKFTMQENKVLLASK